MSGPYPNSGSWRRPTRAWLEAHNAMREAYPHLYPPAEDYLAEFGLTLDDVVETAEEAHQAAPGSSGATVKRDPPR